MTPSVTPSGVASFRTLQAMADLRAAARWLAPAAGRVMPGSPEAVLAAVEPGRNPLHASPELREALLLAAASPEDRDACCLATAVLLHDRLAQGTPDAEDFAWFWEAGSETYRTAPAPVRAALMNGLSRARDCGLAAQSIAPTEADRITAPARDLLPPLIALARAMTEEERRAVAHADYCSDVERHLAALNAVLARPDCTMTADEYWFPSEVVELRSHVPGSEGFVPCTALLMIQAIHDGDRMGNMEFRWESNHEELWKLGRSISESLLQGFRFLYETDPYFDPFQLKDAKASHGPIPWFAP